MYTFSIQRAIKLREDVMVDMFDPLQFEVRSRDLPIAYHNAGQYYCDTRDTWLTRKPIFAPRSAPVFLPKYRGQDIETPKDWAQAELIMEVLRKS